MTSTYPGDTDGDGTLNVNETKALLNSENDNSLKALIRAQVAASDAPVTEIGYCISKDITKDGGNLGRTLQFLTKTTDQHYELALNKYLQDIKTDDGYDQYQTALRLNGIGAGNEFAGLEHIELPSDFCAIRKKNPDKIER